MAFWLASLIGLAVAYLLGSVPTGYLMGKLLRGIDIRQHGSGSTGATNVLRTLGPWPALLVLSADILKGVAAVALARWLCAITQSPPDEEAVVQWVACLAELAALFGHGRSIWLDFSGGKSAATGLGVLAAVAWPVGLGAVLAFGVVLATFRIVSLGSMLAAGTAIVLIFSFDQPLPSRLLVIAGGLYVVARHRANIQRLLVGTEPRLTRASLERP